MRIARELEEWLVLKEKLASHGDGNLPKTVPPALPRGIRAISHLCRGRRFGITEQGRPCLVPEDTRTGDLIYLIQSARVPFVLRPAEGQIGVLKLVGEAYVHRHNVRRDGERTDAVG